MAWIRCRPPPELVPGIIEWRILAVAQILLPCILGYLNSQFTLRQFAPRQVISSGDLFPLFTAPWAAPTSTLSSVSRFIQAAMVYYYPTQMVWRLCIPLWIYIASARTLVAYILSRSVGWAYPPLFSHNAVYEAIGGFGPILVAIPYIAGDVTSDCGPSPASKRKKSEAAILYYSMASCICLALLDNTPWTYSVTVVSMTIVLLLRPFFLVSRKFEMEHLPISSQLEERSVLTASDPRPLLRTSIVSIITLAILSRVISFLTSPMQKGMPMSPLPPSPLMDIVILSHPRPNVEAATAIMETTIASYLPFTNENITLSIFTHSDSHEAFQNVQNKFRGSDVTFYVDRDSHPKDVAGQYLHLAEAFRWENEKGSRMAEWTMLIEDDFPVCGGARGWSSVEQVMSILEAGRPVGGDPPLRRGGFVGTGGSGFIIHRTLLPILIHILRTYSETVSKLPEGIPRRPPDVVVQDCLLGGDPMCPPKHDGGLVITSRLVLDHIGGMVSTNVDKPSNTDKWRCGWRHPFHGRPEVEVVVVESFW